MIYLVSVSTVLQQGSSKFKPNKHGVWPLVLTSINGAVLPENSSVLDGSVAESLGIKAGSSYSLLITERTSQKVGDKVYRNYNFAVVGGDMTVALGQQMASAAISSISSMFAAAPAQMLIANPPVSKPEPVLIADSSLNLVADMSVAELDKLLKAKKAAEKAAKEAADAAALAGADADDQPF
jgi:hypothetical protein